jgi:hypothetical protein
MPTTLAVRIPSPHRTVPLTYNRELAANPWYFSRLSIAFDDLALTT